MIIEAITCERLSPFINIIKDGLFPIIQFGIPIIIIILGSIDLAKAVISGKEDVAKSSTSNFIRRIFYGIAIFFVPTIVNLVFNLFETTGDEELQSINFFECWTNPIKTVSSPTTSFNCDNIYYQNGNAKLNTALVDYNGTPKCCAYSLDGVLMKTDATCLSPNKN